MTKGRNREDSQDMTASFSGNVAPWQRTALPTKGRVEPGFLWQHPGPAASWSVPWLGSRPRWCWPLARGHMGLLLQRPASTCSHPRVLSRMPSISPLHNTILLSTKNSYLLESLRVLLIVFCTLVIEYSQKRAESGLSHCYGPHNGFMNIYRKWPDSGVPISIYPKE